MQEFEEDYYAILGVEEDSAPEEIRKAYIMLAKKLHPDKHPNDPVRRDAAQRQFAQVTRAHDVVSDPERRREYDAFRMLKRKKELGLSSDSSLPVQNPDELGETLDSIDIPKDLDKTIKMSVRDSQGNINVKWANKHLQRADDLLRKKRYQEAETAMKEAIRLVPEEARYHTKLAEVYFSRGWFTLATTEVQTALRLDGRDAEARNLETKIKAAARDHEEAKANQKSKKSFFQQLKDILTKEL